MAGKAQKAVTRFKDRTYLPEVEQLKQGLLEKKENEKNKIIFGKCYEQFSAVLQGKVRNIPGEVDKWGMNLLLNRTFLESGLTTNDIIR